MEKKLIIISAISLILVILIASIIIISIPPQTSPVTKPLQDCKILKENNQNAINLVFFANKSITEKYYNFLFTISPFDKNKQEFNIYYIDDYTPNCNMYKGIAILCYSKEIIKKASSCPNDYIIVVKNEDMNIRSSSYMNVMSLNSNLPMTVFAHEFGHAFANFAEEYTPADIPSNSKNCQGSCEPFNNSNGCFNGCSKESYFRSIENGIMRTLFSQEFGQFDESLIIDRINKNQQKITGNIISSQTDCSQQSYYLIEGNYSNNQMTILDQSIQRGCIGSSGYGGFNYLITLKDNTSINQGNFNPELIFTDTQLPNQTELTGQTYLSDQIFTLKIPLIDNAKSLQISKDNLTVLDFNLNNLGATPCQI